jgi:hypothetical protein
MRQCVYCGGVLSKKSLEAGRCQNCGAGISAKEHKVDCAESFWIRMELAFLLGVRIS